MKRVKFNATTIYQLIPDNQIDKLNTDLKALEWDDRAKYRDRLLAMPSHYITGVAQIGEILDVPDNYYEKNRNRVVSIPNCIMGRGETLPMPYKVKDVQKWRDDADVLLKTVKMFDLIEDLNMPTKGEPVLDDKIDKRLKEYRDAKAS